MLSQPTKIKIELLKKEISAAEIARRAGVVRSAISNVIAGRRKSKKLRKAIADAIGEPVEALWPEDKAA